MKRIAFTNQKGGVGKTTSAINVGAGLTRQGENVLLVDMDPQANLTYSLRNSTQKLDKNVYHVLKGEVRPEDAIIGHNGFDVLPASIELSGADMEMVNEPARESMLKMALQDLDQYDYILVDCPPNLGLLTLNALTAVSEAFIVLQTEYLALHGLSKLMNLIEVVEKRLNPSLEVTGIICTLFDGRKNLNKEVVQHIKDHFGSKVFKTIIRDNVKLAEAPSHHKTIFEYDADSRGAEDYMALSQEINNGYLEHVQ